jgi:pimeloyl-ACP methyl ester carboxylesterase
MTMSKLSRTLCCDQSYMEMQLRHLNLVQAIKMDLQELSPKLINIPVLILSEDKSPTFQTAQAIAAWNQVQASMLKLSPESYRVIARNSDHFLQFDCPAFATEEIQRFLGIDRARPQREYGTTITLPCK